MAKQSLIWTVLPLGKRKDRWCVSVVVSPRLTPQSLAERELGHAAWAEWQDWPATLSKLKLTLLVGGGSVGLKPIADPKLAPDSSLWEQLFFPRLKVAEFGFIDISQVNLRSYPVRGIVGLLRRQYGLMAAQAGGADHPLLLPWRKADPVLKGFLSELGTRTVSQNFGGRTIEQPLPGFSRFHAGRDGKRPHDNRVNRAVFNANSCIKAPARLPGPSGRQTVFNLRALPPQWEDPALIRNGAIQVAPADREPRAELMEQFSGAAEYALWQSDRFYQRTLPSDAQLKMRRPGFSGVAAAITPPEFDFHQRIASFGDHPNLLRKLGLVIDCELESNALLDALLAGLAPGAYAQGLMKLKLTSAAPHQAAGDLFPSSAFQINRRRFCMRARTADHANGLLKLERVNDRCDNPDAAFDLYQIDPDGAALKTVNTLLTAQNLVGRSLELGADGAVTYTTGDRQPLANLRAGGIGVSRHGRAGQVAINAATAALNDAALRAGGAAAAAVTLFAEDVLRGYRVDVRDKGSERWRSLCEREGRYEALPQGALPARQIPLPPDEGHVKGASTASPEVGSSEHYLHETLFRWTGWSLVAPRPGRTLRDATVPGTHLQIEEVVDQPDPSQVAPQGNGLSVLMAARKGSLPRLRFGQSYRLRARLVDLAGNSLALEEPEDLEQASDALRYGRFEPVDPPALVLRQRMSEGESLERLVIRSNYDCTAADYTAKIAGDLAVYYDNEDFDYTANAQRHIVPPKSAQLQCEQHGLFDTAIGSSDAERIKKAYAVAAREAGSLLQAIPGAQPELITPKRLHAIATVQGGLIPPPEQADATKDRFAPGQYLIHREPIVPVPYLPDAACGGIALTGVPGLQRWVEGKSLQELAPGLLGWIVDKGARVVFFPERKSELILLLDFDRDPKDPLAKGWPAEHRSLRLELIEQGGEVTKPPCGPEHTEPSPPKWLFDEGVLAVFLPKGHIARLRYASFVHDKLVQDLGLPHWQDQAVQRRRLQVEGLAGCNWMLTPWRRLTLVHATQQPVCPPLLYKLEQQRALGEQHTRLKAPMVQLHGPSTGKFEIVGEWDEWIDDPALPEPKRVHHQAVLSEIRLAENHVNRFSLAEAVAAQRAFTPVGGQVQPLDLENRPAVPGDRHEFGDTRFRFIRYRLRATTRFREYLPPKLFAVRELICHEGDDAEVNHVAIQAIAELGIDKDAGAPVLPTGSSTAGALGGLIVPASGAPLPPEIVYVLPTFRWERPTSRQSTRHGNGLRVYLERPWFSSGDGELLGVVLAGEGKEMAAITPAQLPLVSQWGQDPLWDSAKPVTVARANQVPLGVHSENLQLQEGPTVLVIGHRVHFDAARKLWYADIELNSGMSYMPFVRLALVRYQPLALGSAKASTVVLADFAQLLPRRRAVLTRSGRSLSLSVHGPVALRGPTRASNAGGANESEWANVSQTPPRAVDSRNRLEWLLQRRPASLDSDLAWEDVRVLASARVGGDPATRGAPDLEPEDGLLRRADDSVKRRNGAGQTLRFDRLQQLPAQVVVQQPPLQFDPAVWEASVLVPAQTAGFKHRLLLREFERFYTDRTVPDADKPNWRRVVIEERLVYAETFEIPV